jgi:hypothetical protein
VGRIRSKEMVPNTTVQERGNGSTISMWSQVRRGSDTGKDLITMGYSLLRKEKWMKKGS